MNNLFGQITLFDLMKEKEDPNGFRCWDEDINELVKKLDNICKKYGLSSEKPKFSIWNHVPKFGYRLTYTIKVKRDSTGILDDLQEITDEYKLKKIDVSPMSAGFHWGEDQTASLYVFTTYEDARRKVKKPESYKAVCVSA